MLAAEERAAFPAAEFSSIARASRVAVAVSGGSDSLALLLLAHEWAQRRGAELHAITFDHGLRAGSDAEAQWVASVCAALAIPHVTLGWRGTKPTTGIQAKARRARYEALTGWCHDHQVEVLLTGHTLDDQAETVAMRAMRTSTDRSIAGILPEMDWQGVRVVRPLLGMRRSALQAFLRRLGQAWIDDPSNSNMRFERVRVRKALAVNDVPGLAAKADAARHASSALAAAAAQWATEHVSHLPEGAFEISLDDCSTIDSDILDCLLFSLAFSLSGRRPKDTVSRRRLLDWVRSGAGSRMTDCGCIFARRKGKLMIGREPGRIPTVPVPIPPSGELMWDHRFAITGPAGSTVLPAYGIKNRPRLEDVPAWVCDGHPCVVLDHQKLCFPVNRGENGCSAEFRPTLSFL